MNEILKYASKKDLKLNEEALKEFLEADKDMGNNEVKLRFSSIEGEDFIELEDFESK